MIEPNDDKLVHELLSQGKKEIADNGFSRRVMHRLPNRVNRLSQIGSRLVTIVSMVLFVAFGGLQAVWETLRETFVGMVEQGSHSTLDLQSLIIAFVVILFLATKRLYSLS